MEIHNNAYLVSALLQISMICAENLYGATLNWRPSVNLNEVVFSYRLSWQLGAIPGCTISSCPGKDNLYLTGNFSVTTRHLARWQNYRWICTAGCQNNDTVLDMTELFLTDIAGLHETQWETAIEMKPYRFHAGDNLANIQIGFQDPTGKLVDRIGEGYLSLAVRNDTKKPNISPVINVFPVYRVPLGCSTTIQLFPFDGDGDYVKCHWQKFPKHGTEAATIVLNEDLCEMTITATTSAGFTADQELHLSLFAEDYSYNPVKFDGLSKDISSGPFSRVPIKLYVYVAKSLSSPADCITGPRFERGAVLEGQDLKKSYNISFDNAQVPFGVSSKDMAIVTIGPRLMTFVETSLFGKLDSKKEIGTWAHVHDPDMKGIHQSCGQAYSKDGVPGESSCAVLMVGDPDECGTSPCTSGQNGICNNLFEYYTCTYSDVPPPNTGNTSSLCQPEIIVNDGKDDLGLKVGLPIGLSILWLIILVATVAYLKRYWMEKLKNSTVGPEQNTNGVATKLTEKMPNPV